MSGALETPRDLPEWLNAGPENVEGIAAQLCEEVHGVSGRPCVLVMRDAGAKRVSVVAASAGADRRLVGLPVSSFSAAGRASSGDVPIAGRTSGDLLGERQGDRRAREEEGVAFPVRDGREGVGALVVFGQPDAMPDRVREHIAWLVANAGPKLGRAATVRAAESRATTDELTGLPNRRALERAMAAHGDAACSVLCVDLDHFKKLNDGFGHAAGDAALRHMAGVFRNVLREDDLPCRIGGEEFALWLPGAPADRAMEVAGRILGAVRESLLEWGGAQLQMTCSIGVAAVPDTVARVKNLLGAADVALYRAKEEGRDRVVLAQPGRK
jgi:diguanylate cyclase (GGDEF)-like protein